MDIDHPWQGDLSLVLTPPSGTAAILQDKKGAGTHNLKKVFDISSAPELQNLLSQTLKGDWTLGVRDIASRDEGILKSWFIEAEGKTNSVIELNESTSVSIPDNRPARNHSNFGIRFSRKCAGSRGFCRYNSSLDRDLAISLISQGHCHSLA